MSTQRELKFRIWDGETMYYPSSDTVVTFFNGEGLVRWAVYQRMGGARVADSQYESEIMQFTGLHDKNGREIYDRDIVDGYDGLRFDVQWLEYDAEWNIGGYDAKRMDVIGNCFENPELIPTN